MPPWYGPGWRSVERERAVVAVVVGCDRLAAGVAQLDGDAREPELPLLDLARACRRPA